MITREMQIRIKIRLLEKGWKQKDLCHRFGISSPHLNRMINGIDRPRPDVAAFLSEMIGVSVDELVGKPAPDQAA